MVSYTRGSSPRVWGEVGYSGAPEGRFRIIPTRVGRRNCESPWRSGKPDHPHACGEKLSRIAGPECDIGSSPRVWGEGADRPAVRHPVRIIPTRVGRSAPPSTSRCRCSDHPHACGEKVMRVRIPSWAFGSSPRVWGEEYADLTTELALRIIPTRVGRSKGKSICVMGSPDHPHACGEKPIVLGDLLRHAGSSPRVWGEARWTGSIWTRRRIIPTRVGRRSAPHPQRTDTSDHPHACGEKAMRARKSVLAIGSSPRVWGEVDPRGRRSR